MSDLYFNELSVNTEATNEAHANALLQGIFDLCDSIHNLNLTPVKLRITKDLTKQNILTENYTIYNFLNSLNKNDKGRYATYLAQSSYLHDNPYYTLEEEEVIGFGHAFEADGLAISINNADNWSKNSYPIRREYLADGESTEIEYEIKEVKHLSYKEEVEGFAPFLTTRALERSQFKLGNIESIANLWQKREDVFPNLEFCSETEGMLLHYGSINNPTFKKAATYLGKLNFHLLEAKMKRKKFDEFPGDVTPDSPQTLKTYSEERKFTLPSGNREVFSLHAKLGELRIYFYPDAEKGTVAIGHVGGHLNTTKYKAS